MKQIAREYKIQEFKKRIGITEGFKINRGDGGVYTIYSVNTGWCYVGQTGNFKGRFRWHISALRNKRHHNRKLQEIYNEFGIEDLECIPVYKCPEFMRQDVERAYITKLGLNVLNENEVSLNWEEIKNEREIENNQKIMIEGIPKKYRIILMQHKNWKYKDSKMRLNEYLNSMFELGIKIKKEGFKWIDEIDNIYNMKVIDEYAEKYNDLSQMALDYIALAILNDILGKENDEDIFKRGLLNSHIDIDSDDLMYNIYKKIRCDNIFRNDIILASISFAFNRTPRYNCEFKHVNMFEDKIKISSVFDVLYAYLIVLFIFELRGKI